MEGSLARKVVFGRKEEIGSLGHLIRLGDVKESCYVMSNNSQLSG